MRGQQQSGCFELSVGNPDKGVLPIDTVRERIAQFVEAGLPVVVTQVCRPAFLSVPTWSHFKRSSEICNVQRSAADHELLGTWT